MKRFGCWDLGAILFVFHAVSLPQNRPSVVGISSDLSDREQRAPSSSAAPLLALMWGLVAALLVFGCVVTLSLSHLQLMRGGFDSLELPPKQTKTVRFHAQLFNSAGGVQPSEGLRLKPPGFQRRTEGAKSAKTKMVAKFLI